MDSDPLDLVGSHWGAILKSNQMQFYTREHNNESIYYNVDALEQAIKTYGGPLQKVDLELDRKLIDAVYDCFREGLKMTEAGDKVRTIVQVQLSPAFWGWLFQFVEQMNILGPDKVKEEYRTRVASILD